MHRYCHVMDFRQKLPYNENMIRIIAKAYCSELGKVNFVTDTLLDSIRKSYVTPIFTILMTCKNEKKHQSLVINYPNRPRNDY